jgi:hypothetical protein
MPKLELPEGLFERLHQLFDTLTEQAEPLEASSGGQEVLAAIEDLNTLVGRELRIFARAVGTRHYHARVYLLEQIRKGNRSRWQLDSVQLAEAEFMPGGPGHLRALMKGGMENIEGKGNRMAVWVRAMPEVGDNTFFAFLIHSSGFETTLSLDEKGWSHVRVNGAKLELTLGSMMRPRPSRMEIWQRLQETQIGLMDESLRGDFTELWKDHTRSPMTDELWQSILEMIFLRGDLLMFMHEVGRATSVGLIQESQKLQGALVHLVEKLVAEHNEKLAQMEKSHTRALAKFKTDLERHRSSTDVVRKRLTHVEREAQELRNQLKRAGGGGGADVSQQSIALTLDRFFT